MFQEILKKVLRLSNLKQPFIETNFMNRLDKFQQAFTSSSFDPNFNNEAFEMKGDAVSNAFLVFYFFQRFPQLDCPNGVPILARLKIVYAPKQTFGQLAENLGFWPFILASQEKKSIERDVLLVQTLKAFIGVIVDILDHDVGPGFGFTIICRILTKLFDKIDIQLNSETLYDPKSLLKEFLDTQRHLGNLVTEWNHEEKQISLYLSNETKKKEKKTETIPTHYLFQKLQHVLSKHDDNNDMTIELNIYGLNCEISVEDHSKKKQLICSAKASSKMEAEKEASLLALKLFKQDIVDRNFPLVC
jgi:dsRNA-specific ribonuclease